MNPPHPRSAETGWLPDCVFTGGRFEQGLAFFADDLGRITRFSREPADLAAARRLAGQAALPGLVNGHSRALQRTLRGRVDQRGAGWGLLARQAAARLSPEAFFDTVRMAFLEMMHGGITCVGEFHSLVRQADGSPWPEADFLGREMIRAARSTGVRIALVRVIRLRGGFRAPEAADPGGWLSPAAEAFIDETEGVRRFAEEFRPGDEAWVGVGFDGWGSISPEAVRAVAAYAHAQRLRLHFSLSATRPEHEGCVAAHGRTPAALAAHHGLLDKRFTALGAGCLTDEDVQLLGSAKVMACACPASSRNVGEPPMPVAGLRAAGAILALGTGCPLQIDLLDDARMAAPEFRTAPDGGPLPGAEVAGALFHAATVSGARSLGGPGGALEVGRPADFFTVNLYDPALAGASADALLANLVFSPARRAVREVWVGGRQRVVNGRHPDQGEIVARFVEAQRRAPG